LSQLQFLPLSKFPCLLEQRICFEKYSFLDSDDSDTEGGLGNIERVVMRPPGHSGKAKRGHLCFDACFETGLT